MSRHSSRTLEAFMSDVAHACRKFGGLGLPLREQAGVFFGFAVGAMLGAGVKPEDIMGLAIQHIDVALKEAASNKSSVL